MFVQFLGMILSALSSPVLGRVLDVVEARVDSANAKRLDELRALTAENADMVSFNKAKLEHKIFWGLIVLFAGPLGVWWSLVIADSIFHFPFDIANLPTPEMRTWAGDMIRWLFYVGSVTAALKVVSK